MNHRHRALRTSFNSLVGAVTMPSAEAMVALLPDICLIAPYASMCPSTTHCTQSPTSNEERLLRQAEENYTDED